MTNRVVRHDKNFVSKGREFSIGTGLKSDEKEKLVRCLVDNLDVFAKSPV